MKKEGNLLVPFWLKSFKNLKCGFTLPEFGNQALTRRSCSSGKTTKQNRIALANFLNINSKKIFSPYQVHSNRIIIVDEKKIGKGAYSKKNAIKGDACITNIKDVLLIVTWADCVPVLLYDDKKRWIAAIHSGWKGTRLNIVGETIKILIEKKIKIKDLYAAVGPGIKDCCYKVGDEFLDLFKYSLISKYLIKKKEGLYFNLAKAVYKQLLLSGIKKKNIDFFGKCNSCCKFPHFFSFRKNGINFEAQAAFIGIFK